jgi:hypothetical protein
MYKKTVSLLLHENLFLSISAYVLILFTVHNTYRMKLGSWNLASLNLGICVCVENTRKILSLISWESGHICSCILVTGTENSWPKLS